MQETTNDPFFVKAKDPVMQASVILGFVVIFMALTKVASLTGAVEFKDYFPWIISASFLLFFTVLNSLFSLSSDDINKYWIRSISSYLCLAIVSGALAYLASSVSFNDAGTIRWIFYVLTFVYLVFLSILNFMKKIVAFAEREEWTAPKKRSKNRKNRKR
ncbi:MAG: hypothetical protein AB8F94_19045 [Saprospiraceae bacterium]